MTFSARNKSILDGIVEHGRLANGYIFHGRAGSFVEEGALYFAQRALACEPTRSADFVELRLEGKIGVEDIRFLKERVKYGPSVGKTLMAIVFQAETMSPEAANAFLKVLEEPPSGVCFVLVTGQPFALLSTIRSRCQSLDFPFVSEPAREFEPMSYFDFVKMDMAARWKLAEEWASDKENAQQHLLHWLSQIAGSADKNAEILVSKVRDFRYNLNVRLHLEALFLTL